MKNKTYLYRGLLAAGMLLLCACNDEEFVREAGTQPDPEAMTEISATLYRADPVAGRVILSEGDITDVLRCRLSMPAPQGTELTLAVDEEAVGRYNADNGTELPLFPAANVKLSSPETIPAGKKESGDLTVRFEREGVEKGRYLLPVTLAVSGLADASTDEARTVCYEVLVVEKAPAGVLDKWDFKVVGYVNTEEVNPLICNQFLVGAVSLETWEDLDPVTWIDICVLRKATIGINASTGRVELKLGADLQYVLDHAYRYIVPTQKLGRKVLVCVQGGGSGVGFRNLTDEQAADFVWQLRKVLEDYHLDGVNFMDTDAGYDKEGAPAIVSASYAKLIKAAKEALGEKMVTLVCDAQSNAELSVPQDGIEAGRYIDLAWTGAFDVVTDPWTEGTAEKPVAGLERSRYGGGFLQTHDTAWNAENSQRLEAEVKDFYDNHSQSANVWAFWDMPVSRSGIEKGPGTAFEKVINAMSDWDMVGSMKFYEIKYSDAISGQLHGYGMFAKDW